jgi:hypothetical protein
MGGKDLPSGNCLGIIILLQLLPFKERRTLAGGIHVSHRILQCHESYRKAILLNHIAPHKRVYALTTIAVAGRLAVSGFLNRGSK